MFVFAIEFDFLILQKPQRNSDLDDSGISLPVSPCRADLKLCSIYVTPKLV